MDRTDPHQYSHGHRYGSWHNLVYVIMRSITLIIVHCSATPAGVDYSALDIDRWHRQRGWSQIGYHYVVRLDGSIEKGRPETLVGAHCKDHNRYSIGVCYIGGLSADGGRPLDTRTPEQRASLHALLKRLHDRYPRALIVGHNTFCHKACPCFDPISEYAGIFQG